MKKQVTVVAAMAGLALGAAIAQGAVVVNTSGSQGTGIVGSVHDLSGNSSTSGTNYGVSDPSKRICAFCHSPHHSKQDNQTLNGTAVTGLGTDDGNGHVDQYKIYAPLWSRTDLATAAQADYGTYVSQTFNPVLNGGKAYDPLIGPSRLCLTCHDGSIALDAYYGKVAGDQVSNTTTDDFSGPVPGSGNIAIARTDSTGMGLRNDHPIGMKYTDYLSVVGAETDYELMPLNTHFKDTSNADGKTIAQVLYNDPSDTAISNFVTCASCHDVHNGKAVGNKVPTGTGMRGFLLYGSQVRSSFCLTCHDKNNGVVPAGN